MTTVNNKTVTAIDPMTARLHRLEHVCELALYQLEQMDIHGDLEFDEAVREIKAILNIHDEQAAPSPAPAHDPDRTPKTDAMTIWILHIRHKHGDNYSAHRTEDAARNALRDYCEENWDDGLTEQYGATETLSRDDLIEAYFDAWGDALDPECYVIVQDTPDEPDRTPVRSHTPGPWSCEPYGDYFRIEGMGEELALVASYFETAPEEGKANARLIASAPEFLEALDMAVRALCQPPSFNTYILDEKTGRHLGSYKVLARLQTLLRKVKGKQG